MNWVSGKEQFATIRCAPPTRTMCTCGTYLCREFSVICGGGRSRGRRPADAAARPGPHGHRAPGRLTRAGQKAVLKVGPPPGPCSFHSLPVLRTTNVGFVGEDILVFTGGA